MTLFRRLFAGILMLSLVLSLLPQGVRADSELQEPVLISEAAILMDADSGQILYGKNMDAPMYPASITKILTGYLALKYGNPADELTVSEEVVNQVPRTSSHIALLPGEVVTLKDALYGLALVSANDAAVAIAEHISGSVEDFAELMNQEAAALGAYNSHFVNPNGMPAEDHYTTARDMAIITAAALRMPDFNTYFGGGEYDFPATNLSEARKLVSKNKFIDGSMECPGLLISKTGWTSSALGTLVTAAKQGSTTLIAVVMKSPVLEDKYTDTEELYGYGFHGFQRTRLSRNMMEDKLREQGMGENGYLDGYSPLDVLMPIDTEGKDIIVTIPGGFDADSGVSTIPVSVDVQRKNGTLLHIKDLLVTIAEAEPTPLLEVETSAERAADSTKRTLHPGVFILLGLAAVLILFRLIARKKVYR